MSVGAGVGVDVGVNAEDVVLQTHDGSVSLDHLGQLLGKVGAEGGLSPDPAQEGVLPKLDAISTALKTAPDKSSGIGWLFSKKVEPIRGLYLWGGVGRGKSMLMDLFHEATALPRSRRVHFHEFMQEVQAALHEARQSEVEDAILPVADALANDLRLGQAQQVIVTAQFMRPFSKAFTAIILLR